MWPSISRLRPWQASGEDKSPPLSPAQVLYPAVSSAHPDIFSAIFSEA